MAGKRKHSQADAGPGSKGGAGQPTATVFRKSAKKARLDAASASPSSTSAKTHQKSTGPKAGGGAGNGIAPPKPKPKPQISSRPRDQPKPRTKHEFIQQKKAQAALEAAKEKEKKQDLVKSKKEPGTTKPGSGDKKKSAQNKPKKPKIQPQPPALVLPPPANPVSSFRIIVGSYERLLYGFQASLSAATSSTSTSSAKVNVYLKPYFIFPAHVSAIRTIASGPEGSRWLATGGTDELIKIWDLKKRVEVGALTGHEGNITSLAFPSRTFLISTGSDGRINIFRARDWALLRTLKGHTGAINSAGVHPSGRLALSVGKDRTIRMWDLMRAKGAASTKLGVEGELIRWDTRGERFVVLSSTGGGEGMVFRTDMTRLHALEGIKRLHDVQFVRARMIRGSKSAQDGEEEGAAVEHELMLVASEDKKVHVFDLDQSALDELEREQAKAKAKASQNGKTKSDNADQDEDEDDEEDDAVPLVEIGRLVGHENRVKALGVQHVKVPSSSASITSPDTTVLTTTISSDGRIRVFDLAPLLHLRASAATSELGSEAVPELESIAMHDTKGSRLTCLSIAPGGGGTAGAAAAANEALKSSAKGKGKAIDEDDDDDDDEDLEDDEDGFLASDAGSESDEDAGSADEDEDDDDEDDDDDLDVDLAAEAEELARLEKEIEEARNAGLDIPSDFEDLDDDEEEEFEDEDEDEEEDE
ncbi:Protein mak11 [Tilletia horrida]|uniref:Protein mak11 n=1 Tax=Tilletia horrida TaxID=155126 RepID=A0AAN6JZQ3_9BASI|nr:Protein mak11 [Tilletia horrida]KAK0568580.1 Protein mak11 [Tilletia horrida]